MKFEVTASRPRAGALPRCEEVTLRRNGRRSNTRPTLECRDASPKSRSRLPARGQSLDLTHHARRDGSRPAEDLRLAYPLLPWHVVGEIHLQHDAVAL